MNLKGIKGICLLLLVIQNTFLGISMKIAVLYSTFNSVNLVIYAEALKVLVCIIIILYTNGINKGYNIIKSNLLAYQSMLKMAIPSGIYAIQNNILYIALYHLSVAVYQVSYIR